MKWNRHMFISNKCIQYCCGLSKLLSPIRFIFSITPGTWMLWWICMHIICLWISYTVDLNLLRRNLGFLHQVHSMNSTFYYISSRPAFKMWLEFCNICGFTAFFHKSKRIFVLHYPVWIQKRIAIENITIFDAAKV